MKWVKISFIKLKNSYSGFLNLIHQQKWFDVFIFSYNSKNAFNFSFKGIVSLIKINEK